MRMRQALAIATLAGATAIGACSKADPADDKKPDNKAAQSAGKSRGPRRTTRTKKTTRVRKRRARARSRSSRKRFPPKNASTRCRARPCGTRRRRSRAPTSAPNPKQPKEITCTFEITQLGGTAPKFDCKNDNGDRLRIKYGRTPEVPSEVASAKLLHTLGFGADNVMLVEKVRCYGCPAEPFTTMKALGFAGAQKLYEKVMDPKDYKDFEWAAVERKHYGRAIETEEVEGWAFFEPISSMRRKAAHRARTSMRFACWPCSCRTGTTRARTSG